MRLCGHFGSAAYPQLKGKVYNLSIDRVTKGELGSVSIVQCVVKIIQLFVNVNKKKS